MVVARGWTIDTYRRSTPQHFFTLLDLQHGSLFPWFIPSRGPSMESKLQQEAAVLATNPGSTHTTCTKQIFKFSNLDKPNILTRSKFWVSLILTETFAVKKRPFANPEGSRNLHPLSLPRTAPLELDPWAKTSGATTAVHCPASLLPPPPVDEIQAPCPGMQCDSTKPLACITPAR